jgi:type II secretory pathway component GspD/PulD (secretin)
LSECSEETLEKERLVMIGMMEKCVRAVSGAAVLLAMCTTGGMAQGPDKQPESYQAFYLKNATNQNTANDIQTAMRNLMPRAHIYYAASENALMISGTAEELAQAQKILADLDKPQKVYRVTYEIGDGHGTPSHIALLVTPGKWTMAKQGTRVPIMTGSYKEGGAEAANTQFQYVDIGMSVSAQMEGYGDGLRLVSKIEATSVSEQKSNVGIQDPVIKQSVLEGQSPLGSGKPVRLGLLELPDGKMDVQVTVETLQ